MADISDVNITVIKDLYQRLEELSCEYINAPHGGRLLTSV